MGAIFIELPCDLFDKRIKVSCSMEICKSTFRLLKLEFVIRLSQSLNYIFFIKSWVFIIEFKNGESGIFKIL